MANCCICNAEFEPAPRKLTCSPACAKIRQRQKRGENEGGIRDAEGYLLEPCMICARPFRAARGKRTCSSECEVERKRAKWREYWHRLPPDRRAEQAEKIRQRRQEWSEIYRAIDARRRKRIAADADQAEKRRQQARASYVRRRLAAGKKIREPKPKVARVIHFCRTCGAECPPRRHAFCSDACQRLYRPEKPSESILTGLEMVALSATSTPGKYIVTCQECGAEFRTDHAQRQLCSDACKRARYARRKRKGRQQYDCTCEICGHSFIGDRLSAVLCSHECRAESKRRKALAAAADPDYRQRQKLLTRRRKRVQRSCTICGLDMSDFDDLRKNRYTCSENCRREAYRQKQRRGYESRRDRQRLETTADRGDQKPAVERTVEDG